jgi:hypothetical protein
MRAYSGKNPAICDAGVTSVIAGVTFVIAGVTSVITGVTSVNASVALSARGFQLPT